MAAQIHDDLPGEDIFRVSFFGGDIFLGDITVIHGVEKIEEKLKTDEDLENKIETIKKKLTPS